ncbi:MAG TPA: DUF4249 family protein [Bacteroidetes bacterium]|nr:DUF4249 family protein [Bacteroidota bacterium]
MKRIHFGLAILFFALATISSCSTEFEVYAPEKEIRSVYSILKQADSVQYVRVAKAFQVEGDAVAYAAQNDLSIQNLDVRLTLISDPNQTWQGVQIDNFPKDPNGSFVTTHTVYKFSTAGADSLVPGERYRLEVGTADQPGYVVGETTIPGLPRIKGNLQILSGAGQSKCLPKVSLDKKFNFYFQKLEPGVHYEVRVFLHFEANGDPRTVTFGPSELFDSNRRCNQGSGSICFQFGEHELLRTFLRAMPEDVFTLYTYNTTDSCVFNPAWTDRLPKSLSFEVTAVDEYLSNYITVNNPKFSDFSGTKPEYTNLSGNIGVVGVFGSTHSDLRYAIMRQCSEALIHLNGRLIPPGCFW